MRNKGTFNFSGNLEVKKDAPLEAGSIVPTYADLTKAETWTDEEGSVWVYKGKNVTCEDRPGKLYQLTSTDYTKTSNWVEIGGGGTGGGIVEAPEDGKLYGRQNATWSEINDYIMIPEGIVFLENTSTSDEILDAFGGLDQFIELTNEIASNNKPLILAANYAGTSQSIVFIFAMCSTNSSSLNRTLNLYSQAGSDLNSILIRYENGQASFTKIIKGLQTAPEVYYFSPTIQSNKVTQDDYTKLQQAITDGKIITVPVGIADLTTTGSRIPVAAYAIDNEISLNFVIDQDSAYPLWVYIRINGSTRDITVTKSVIKQDVYTFIPTISDGKVTQQDYDNLQASVQVNNIVMVPNGLYQYTVDGSYVPASVQSSDPSSIVLFYTVELNPTNHIMVSITISSNLTVTVVQNEINNGKLKVESSSEAIDLLISNKRITDQVTVKNYINKVLGTNLNTFVNDTLAGKNPNRFIYDNSSYSGVYMTFTGLYNSDDNIVSFIYSCTNSQSLKQLIMNDGSITGEDYLFEVKDIITSDNLNTITKISSTDYAALGTKDPNTMYAVTE